MSNSADQCGSIADLLAGRFRKTYGTTPRIFRAPGRVNLIGEHTDYNDGFVMPAAISFYTWVAAASRRERVLRVTSEQFHESVEFSLNELSGPPRKHWSDFVRGMAAVLQQSGLPLSGANVLIHGDVPIGAGLSSSASLEVATALALLAISDLELPSLEIAKRCQRAEHEYVGTQCGIMDQFIAIFGRAGHALMLDCRSLRHDALAIPADVSIIICNSMVRHDLAAGEYNRRRAECEAGMRILRQHLPHASALRDVTPDELAKYCSELPEDVYHRCRHVISENQRVLGAAGALREGNLPGFGKLMYESHHSLRDDYEVSCHELDVLVDAASHSEGVYGARMTGGGFGGCIVALVRSDAAEDFPRSIREPYRNATGITPDIYRCQPAEGAGEWHSVNVEEV